jgi:hypothetical protein
MKWIERDLGDIENAKIIPLGDLHIGDPLFDEGKFIKLRDWILNEPNVFVILMGDLLNCATKNSVSDTYSEIQNPQEAKKYAIKLLEPIKGKVLGAIIGNHEQRIWKESGIDVVEDIAEKLGCPYGREGLLLNIKMGQIGNFKHKQKINYSIYCAHGTGAGRTIGAKANTLKRASEIVLADIYCIAHIHFMQSFADYYYVPDIIHKKIIKQKRLYCSSASFLNWGGYSETKMFSPNKTGVVKIILSGKRKDYHCSL